MSIITDCFKGLIGISTANECLDVIPQVWQTSRSGLYLDEHPAFITAVVKEPKGVWIEDIWPYVQQADTETRIELTRLLLLQMRRKVEPTEPIRRVAFGEITGSGYLSDFNQVARLTLPTKNVPDAVYVLTHIGIKALILNGSSQNVMVTLKKNGTAIQAWQLTVVHNSEDRAVLEQPYSMPLDGSVYTFEYSFNSLFMPTRNPIDCGCDAVRKGYSCFFGDFTGDAAGLRLLGEVRCTELLWPCMVSGGGLTGLTVSMLYRAILLNFLFRKLDSSRNSRINGFSLIKAEGLAPIITGLGNEIGGLLSDFSEGWEPQNTCCWQVKTRMALTSTF